MEGEINTPHRPIPRRHLIGDTSSRGASWRRPSAVVQHERDRHRQLHRFDERLLCNVNTISPNVDGTGATVTCTNGTAWAASAGAGSGTGATLAARKMTAGANLLGYNLYTSSAYTTVWGDGTGSTATIGGTGSGSAQSVTVYGRVAAGQTTVPAGSYADTVAVTITY